MIEFKQVGLRYADGTQALHDVTLSVPRGQFCVLLGPSGAGKSTLLRTVNGLARPTSGSVSIDGVTMSPATASRLRRRVATVHQHFSLSPRMSVAGNVLSGLLPAVSTARALLGWFEPAQRAKACALLERVGLEPAHLRRRAGELSGGQQQRVGIARAFMLDPEVVLADEPVASLDPRIAQDILSLIRDAARERGATVICSLHQLDLARSFGDRIVGMRAGQVVFDGAPDALDSAQVQALYRATAPAEQAAPEQPVAVPALAA